MAMRALIALLALVLAGGVVWVLVEEGQEPGASTDVPEEREADSPAQDPALEPYLEPMGVAPEEPTAGPLTKEEKQTLREGSPFAVVAVVNQRGYTTPVVRLLIARARSLRGGGPEAEGDLSGVLRLLGESNHLDADAYLVELMRDVAFRVPADFRWDDMLERRRTQTDFIRDIKTMEFFRVALEVSEVEGIADAALDRIRHIDRPATTNRLDAWGQIVVEHGSDAEIWQLMATGHARSPGIYHAAMVLGLERAQRFADVALREAQTGTNGMSMDAYVTVLGQFARYHPDVALPHIRTALETTELQGQPINDEQQRRLAQRYGVSEAIADLAAGVKFVRSIEDPRRRMNAMAALQHMWGIRADDLPLLRPLEADLIMVLDRASRRGSIDLAGDPELGRAMWVVEHVQALRSQATYDAYKRVAKLITGALGKRARERAAGMGPHGVLEKR